MWRRLSGWVGAVALAWASMAAGCGAQAIDLDALMSQPVATELVAAPVGHRFAWVEDAASRRNVWVGGPGEPARNLTGYTEDDGLKTGELAWSPEGKLIAYVRSTPYGTDGRAANPAHNAEPNDPAVWVVRTDAGASQFPVTRIGLGHAPRFLPDGRLLFVRGGSIWVASFSIGGDTGGLVLHPLIEGNGYGSASGLTISPDGKQIAFLSSRERGQHQLAIYDLERKMLRWSSGPGKVVGPRWSPDGREIAFYRAPGDAPEFATHRVSGQPWELEVMTVATGQMRVVYRPQANRPGSVLAEPDNNDPTLGWTSAGRIVFFTEEGGWIHLAAVGADGSPVQEEAVRPGEVDRVALSPDGTRLLVADSYDLPPLCPVRAGSGVHCMAMRRPDPEAIDQRHVEEIDPGATMAPQRLQTGEGAESVAGVAWSADGLYRAALVSEPRRPMHPVVWDGQGAAIDLHPPADPPGLPRASLAAPTQVVFSTAGEPEPLHGQLFLPTNGAVGKRPAVIYFHGGPRRQMQLAYPSSAYYAGDYAFNQYLASLGFVVLSVNYRSGLGYGLDFRQCEGCGAAGAAEYADVLAAQRYLASRPDVDAKRVGLWGGSYGGYLTALGLARNSDLFAAGVDFSGVHEWILERNRGDWLIGSPAQKRAIAARAHASSPMAAVDRWRSPVLLIHGDQDPDVNFAQTTTLAGALRARHVRVETLLLAGETHNFLLHRDWMAAFTAAATFFVQTLQPRA